MSEPMTDRGVPLVTNGIAEGYPRVAGRCPGCGGSSLFLGSGGYVTCARLDCPDPLAGDVDHLREDRDRCRARAEKAERVVAAAIVWANATKYGAADRALVKAVEAYETTA